MSLTDYQYMEPFGKILILLELIYCMENIQKLCYYMSRLVYMDKEHSDWFPEQSKLCNTDCFKMDCLRIVSESPICSDYNNMVCMP